MRPKICIRAACFAAFLIAGCGEPSVQWGPVNYDRLRPTEIPAQVTVLQQDACTGSVRHTPADARPFSVWWALADDARMRLYGGEDFVAVVDSLDTGRLGCSRPPAAVAAPEGTPDVHVAWFGETREGSGIFFAHSMDGGRMFHAPVPIVFGRNPVNVSIDADRSRVAVLHEDPNSAQPRLAIALSRSQGHIFEVRTDASPAPLRARDPLVRLAGDTVQVWWTEPSHAPGGQPRTGFRQGVWR